MVRWACGAAFMVALLPSLQAKAAELIKLDNAGFPDARCLDSSPGAFYFRKASTPQGAKSWVFSLEGGGECVEEAACLDRAKTDLGSSGAYPPTSKLGQLQSASKTHNPDLHAFNAVFVKYCSGDLHLGQQTAASQSLRGVRFSGHHIVDAVIQTLLDGKVTEGAKLSEAELVIWSGDSAGGIGSFAHLDWVADQLPHARVVGVPIGGFYFSNDHVYNGSHPAPISFIPWTYQDFKTYRGLWSAFLPERCVAANAAEPWRCLIAETSYPTLATPVFVVEAQTDKVVMPLHDGLPKVWDSSPNCFASADACPADVIGYMRTWRDRMLQLTATVERSGRDGLFHPACLIHTGFTTSGPVVGGKSYLTAFGDWLLGRRNAHHHVDRCGDVLCNPTCPRAGVRSFEV